MANLSPQQRQLVEQWAAEGANLNQIQDRLRAEHSLTLTYMETRLLIMELGIKIQDKPRETPPEETSAAPAPEDDPPAGDGEPETDAAPADGVQVTVDEIPPAGALVSGKATFSDGVTAQWYMDQMGRFGMRGPTPGYQPPAADIPAFQRELDTLLQLRGF